jgi:hypothetical protein
LSRRLESKRNRQQQQQQQHIDDDDDDDDDDDHDCVLMLEHYPVYTLGRGADETHLTFLQKQQEGDDPYEMTEIRDRLSRTARGVGTARLSADRVLVNYDNNDNEDIGSSLEDAIDRLSRTACPVMAPNGVPIFRVDRGGTCVFVVALRKQGHGVLHRTFFESTVCDLD